MAKATPENHNFCTLDVTRASGGTRTLTFVSNDEASAMTQAREYVKAHKDRGMAFKSSLFLSDPRNVKSKG